MRLETDSPVAAHDTEPREFVSDSHVANERISALDVLVILAERRRLLLTVTASFTIVALLISLVLPKRYTAKTTIMPPQQNSSMASALTSQLGNLNAMATLAGGNLNLKNPNDMYVAMFRTQAIEDAMIRRYELMSEYRSTYMSDARKTFEKRFDVEGGGKDGLIHIAVEDKDPKHAAEMASGYVDEFRLFSQKLAITEASQRRMFFEQQLQQTKDKLADAEETLKATEQTGGMIQLDSQARALIESAASLRAQIAAKEVQLEGMRSYATGENANVVETQHELDGLHAELAKLVGNKDDPNGGLLPPKGVMAQTGLEYVRKLRDVKYYETIFDILARQFEVAKLDEAKEGALIQVVDPATVPDRKSFPKRGLITITGFVVGLLVGILVAFGQEKLARLRQDPESNAKLYRLQRSARFRLRTRRT
jgi:tyrosine-protein kinase Etk/Wzc